MANPASGPNSDAEGPEMSAAHRWGSKVAACRLRQAVVLVALAATTMVAAVSEAAPTPGAVHLGDVVSFSQSEETALEAPDDAILEASDLATESRYPVSMADVRSEVLGRLASADAGSGVDIALIDTGVTPVPGLDGDDKLVHGPDLSAEAEIPELAHLDTHGHGTFMAGIIAGDGQGFQGIAPGARVVSVKVAGAGGETHVAQIIAAIDWVIEHRNDAGLDIRVLNLSLGVDTTADYVDDPLSAAVERAWDAGIVVVVAAGNDGTDDGQLDSPAHDPYVIAVGATESERADSDRDDLVADWSSRGDGVRNPDIVAPGRSLVSLRVPGSSSDLAHPAAAVGDRYARASGTSQAAAVVSGSVAALLAERPYLNPDQVKAAFQFGAADLVEGETADGWGRVRGDWARRRTGRVVRERDALVQDHPRALIDSTATGISRPAGATWSGGTWSGATWSGGTWSGATWSGATWSGATWSGATWSGATWSGATWSGGTWSGGTWSGATWSGVTWSGGTWSGGTWS